MKWLVADWEGNKGHVFQGVVDGLMGLGHSIKTVPRSNMARRDELVDCIRSADFDALLTWQRFYRMQKDLLSAVAESGVKTVFMDFGFRPHYNSVVFDTAGENAASSWPMLWSQGGPSDLSQIDLDNAEELMQAEAARARILARPSVAELQYLRSPFLFVPLQRPGDAVVKYDSSVHDFGELLRRVLLLARGRQYVVCKTHPLDHDLDLGVPDRIDSSHIVIRQSFGGLNEAVCDYLLSKASLVVGVNSNMLFRAMLFGTPIIAAGSGWYTGSGALSEVAGVDALDTLTAPPPDLDAQRRYVATCLSRQLHFDELSDPERLTALLARLGILNGARARA